jgi:hypothetical protein
MKRSVPRRLARCRAPGAHATPAPAVTARLPAVKPPPLSLNDSRSAAVVMTSASGAGRATENAGTGKRRFTMVVVGASEKEPGSSLHCKRRRRGDSTVKRARREADNTTAEGYGAGSI